MSNTQVLKNMLTLLLCHLPWFIHLCVVRVMECYMCYFPVLFSHLLNVYSNTVSSSCQRRWKEYKILYKCNKLWLVYPVCIYFLISLLFSTLCDNIRASIVLIPQILDIWVECIQKHSYIQICKYYKTGKFPGNTINYNWIFHYGDTFRSIMIWQIQDQGNF